MYLTIMYFNVYGIGEKKMAAASFFHETESCNLVKIDALQNAAISPALADEPDNLSADKSIQTDTSELAEHVEEEVPQQPTRNAEESYALLQTNASKVTNQEILNLIKTRRIATHKLEELLGNMERGVLIRRLALAMSEKADGANMAKALQRIPYRSFDYNKVHSIFF